MDEHPDAETGDWASVSRRQHRAWARLSPDERLRWLEDALQFAHACGALTRERQRRQRQALT